MTKTVIHKNDVPYFGEEELYKIAQERNFASMTFEVLSGKTPTQQQSRMFEIILNLCIDHGPDTPSAVETIKSAKNGETISESVAAGIQQITNTHGGAIEPAMELFYKIEKEGLSIPKVVDEYLSKGERIPGFGHRIYEVDPRTEIIFDLCKKQKIADKYIDISREISKELSSKKGRPIPDNTDDAIAAVLCSWGWESRLGKAVFIIARVPGLCGKYLNATNQL